MEPCEKIKTPTTIILLGATGDLAQKKLLPALMELFEKNALPDKFSILAFSRDAMSNDEYKNFAQTHIKNKNNNYSEKSLKKFLNSFSYVQGFFDDKKAYEEIKNELDRYDEKIGTCSSKLFYLAVPPVFYDTIFEQLSSVQLEQPCSVGDGWTRILVEKPFGKDLENAKYLDKRLSKLFNEEQIYRIDHYLAKDALQNILAFRFSNVLFEDRWNKDFVESVYIKVYESFDVSNRGAFFDGVGALRDVGQNHILQMIALIAMDHPEKLKADTLRRKRSEILQSLHEHKKSELGKTIIKGQYEGYKKTKDVNPNSKTETYFAIKTYIDNEKWQGVPFYIEHGKALSENKTEITVKFRSSKNCVCEHNEKHDHQDVVRFTISPTQKITIRFWVRKPGLKYKLEPKDLIFSRNETEGKNMITDAYEEVLYDAINGDQTLFVSNAEQEAAWKYITKILEIWKDEKPKIYKKGTEGPTSEMKKEIDNLTKLFNK